MIRSLPHALLPNGSVITSYSIHYTKLYDAPGLERRKEADRLGGLVLDIKLEVILEVFAHAGQIGHGLNTEAVITSYSIHYTKLYEAAEGQPLCQKCDRRLSSGPGCDYRQS